jgi:hypothetical protein
MPRFVRSALSLRLIRYLQMFEKETMITYEELTTHMESPITSDIYAVQSARNGLLRDYNQVWLPVRPKIGLRRANDREIAERVRDFWLPTSRRKLVRGRRQSVAVDRNHLTGDQKTLLAANVIQAELAMQSLSRATEQRLVKVASGSSNDLPAFNAHEWAITLMPRRN